MTRSVKVIRDGIATSTMKHLTSFYVSCTCFWIKQYSALIPYNVAGAKWTFTRVRLIIYDRERERKKKKNSRVVAKKKKLIDWLIISVRLIFIFFFIDTKKCCASFTCNATNLWIIETFFALCVWKYRAHWTSLCFIYLLITQNINRWIIGHALKFYFMYYIYKYIYTREYDYCLLRVVRLYFGRPPSRDNKCPYKLIPVQ